MGDRQANSMEDRQAGNREDRQAAWKMDVQIEGKTARYQGTLTRHIGVLLSGQDRTGKQQGR
jgi:hypothetical protein